MLEEFRLHAEDRDGTAARIVAERPHGIEPAIPLLTSIEDRRNVATLRAVHDGESTEGDAAQHAALDPLVASWEVPRHYGPRITERSQSPPSSFRLAVTESGINTEAARVTEVLAKSDRDEVREAISLLWIGSPLGTHAGLLILLGHHRDDSEPLSRDSFGWPLSLSNNLGVRIYDNTPLNMRPWQTLRLRPQQPQSALPASSWSSVTSLSRTRSN